MYNHVAGDHCGCWCFMNRNHFTRTPLFHWQPVHKTLNHYTHFNVNAGSVWAHSWLISGWPLFWGVSEKQYWKVAKTVYRKLYILVHIWESIYSNIQVVGLLKYQDCVNVNNFHYSFTVESGVGAGTKLLEGGYFMMTMMIICLQPQPETAVLLFRDWRL